jgi:hypothetical protein
MPEHMLNLVHLSNPRRGTSGTNRVTCSQCQLRLLIVTARPVICGNARSARREAQTAQITDESGRLRPFSVRSTAAAAARMVGGFPGRRARIFPRRSGGHVLVEAGGIHGSRTWPVADRHGFAIRTVEVVHPPNRCRLPHHLGQTKEPASRDHACGDPRRRIVDLQQARVYSSQMSNLIGTSSPTFHSPPSA